jgi:hypothetical protein
MRKCLNCNKDISHKRKSAKYCSPSCSTQHTRRKILHEGLDEGHKRCGKCKSVKPFEDFRKNKNSAFGYGYYCRECDSKRVYKAPDKRKILLNSAKARAKKNNLPFNLDIDDIVLPEVCPIFGIKLEFNKRVCKDNSYSIDKIDPTLGYVKGNIQIISFRANTMKSNATLEEIEMLYKYLLKEQGVWID